VRRAAGRLGDDAFVPALALEMFRVASGESAIALTLGSQGVTSVGVGTLTIPTQPDGSVWLRYARHTEARFVSAADVLAGTVQRETFERKLVLLGVTALGLADHRPIPGGSTMDGVEIHAELIEHLRRRPPGSTALGGVAGVGGALRRRTPADQSVPVKRTRAAWLVLLPLLGLALGGGLALYHWRFLLSTPSRRRWD
jgi:CHASE2 domain-containing sensor protein